MARYICFLLLFLASQISGGYAADLATAPSEDLLRVYAQLRRLGTGNQWAVAENVIWKRDAASFTFRDGKLVFAAPVEGHVLAAAFVGRGTFAIQGAGRAIHRHDARFRLDVCRKERFDRRFSPGRGETLGRAHGLVLQ